MNFELIRTLIKPADTKMVLVVMDGLGGLPTNPQDFTELEKAETPNLDHLAREGICGLHEPIGPGITPGSGPSHLALFGYDPIRFQVGRGVLAALGIKFDLVKTDVAARGNFCTVDKQGKVIDRRAGRIGNEKNLELCKKLRKIKIPDVELFVDTVKEYRFLLVMRGENLSGQLADTDPQNTVHIKKIDSAGEDGDYDRKVALIEEADTIIPRIMKLNPDVLVVTGDHSTPSVMKNHSWHPVPVLLWSKYCRNDTVNRFGERACLTGGLGPSIPTVNLMPLIMANAGRLKKFGA